VDHKLLVTKFWTKGVPHCLVKWLHSLSNRRQWVRLAGYYSSLVEGMPLGSWLGPLSFIVLIYDLMAGPTLYKYVDDTTLSESLPSASQVSDVDLHVKCLLS